jgi:hypothetical protein
MTSDQVVSGSLLLILTIVFSTVGLTTSWAYLKNKEHSLTVSKMGLTVDSRFWPWTEVSRVTFAPSRCAVFINVNNGAMRSTLSHLLQIPANEYSSLEDQLKSIIAQYGIASMVRGKHR